MDDQPDVVESTNPDYPHLGQDCPDMEMMALPGTGIPRSELLAIARPDYKSNDDCLLSPEKLSYPILWICFAMFACTS